MRLGPAVRTNPLQHDDKEAKFRSFMFEDMSAATRANIAALEPAITLVARAPDSPVARTLAKFAGELQSTGHSMRVVFLETDCVLDDCPESANLFNCPGVEIRVLNDSRFGAAHEQLVLNSSRVWIGDCMRRDPWKRDAFEMFHGNDQIAAAHGRVSFAKLWAGARAVECLVPQAVKPEVILAGQAGAGGAKLVSPQS